MPACGLDLVPDSDCLGRVSVILYPVAIDAASVSASASVSVLTPVLVPVPMLTLAIPLHQIEFYGWWQQLRTCELVLFGTI